MTTTKSLGICPRCAYDEFREYRDDVWAAFRGGFALGFMTMAGFTAAILATLAGAFG